MSDAKVKDLSFEPAGSKATGTTYSNSQDVRKYRELIVFADMYTVTTSFDITLQVSPDESWWIDHGDFTQITAAGDYEKRFTNFSRYVRLKMVDVDASTIGSNGIIGTAKT